MTSHITYSPKLYDAESAGSELPDEQSSSAPPPPQDISVLERHFSDLISSLTKRFAELEKTFMRALLTAVKGYQAATAPAAQASPGKFSGAIDQAAKRNELDPSLLRAVVGQESGFSPRAISSAGAMGLMQLMPATAREMGVQNPLDPVQNLEGGARYLRGLIDRYHGRLDFALAAYNAGPGAVDRYGGVPPYAETKTYVKSILSSYRSAALSS